MMFLMPNIWSWINEQAENLSNFEEAMLNVLAIFAIKPFLAKITKIVPNV